MLLELITEKQIREFAEIVSAIGRQRKAQTSLVIQILRH